MPKEKAKMERKTWQEFRESGKLWWLNRILHTFGWSIIVNVNDNGIATEAWPARTDWLGFPPEADAESFEQFKKSTREDLNRG